MKLAAPIELYHWEPTLLSGEILLYLTERGLSFASRYVDLHRLEQHRPEFLRLNPSGQVPVLVHNDRAMTETGLLLQYLEEAFPGAGLMPQGAGERYEAAFWIKYAAERITPAIALLGWREFARPRLSPEAIRAAHASIERLPLERQRVWQQALEDSYSTQELDLARESLAFASGKLEQALAAHPWLAGGTYSIADIVAFFPARALRSTLPDILSPERTPRTLRWLASIEQRPAVAEVFALSRHPPPERMFAPGPELPRWG